MLEQGKKKRVVACAFDWPGWDRSARIGADVLAVLVNGAEIDEFAPKVGVKVPLETRDDAEALRAYRDAFVEGIRGHHTRGESARSWALQFLIRRCAWHMLDHAWELEDRDLTSASASG
jgi:hypothetical protein